jgi:hypothetical protein
LASTAASSIGWGERREPYFNNLEYLLILNRYPDVAANGDNIVVYINGEFQISGGTSASTPIFASLINRINELRLNAGKSTVGFINPALYSHPEMLNDITNGTNPGCGTAGFSAAPGWDPVTGLGKSAYRVGRKKRYTDSVRNSEFPKDGEVLHELAVDGQNDLEEYGMLVWCGIDFLEIYEVVIMPF